MLDPANGFVDLLVTTFRMALSPIHKYWASMALACLLWRDQREFEKEDLARVIRREEEAAAEAARIEAERQARIDAEEAAEAKKKARGERREERAKIRVLVLKGEDVPSKELSRAEAKKKRPPPPPKRAPPPKRKAPAQVPSRRRTGGAFIQACHAVDSTSP